MNATAHNSSLPIVAFLGLGAMGSRMARRLLDAGYPLRVWNRTPKAANPLVEAGAERAESPRAAAEGAAYAISMVRDDEAAQRVWLAEDGALGGLEEGAIAIESSTVTPTWAKELANALREAGAQLLEAPVLGSRPQAEAGQLIYLLSGPEAVQRAAEPVLQHLGGRILPVGAPGEGYGQAAVAKLAINTYFATQAAALGEALTALRGAELADEAIVELLSGLPVVAPALAGLLGAMSAGRFAPLFPIDLVEKDLGYFLEHGATGNHPASLARATREIFALAKERGHGSDHISGIVQLFNP
ncbi:MAG: NAD(P)-dependent oxidoreductase [Acidobacteriota bacterium]